MYRGLTTLEEQGQVEGSFNNTANSDQLGALAQDIYDARMEYQVFSCNLCISYTF